MFSHCQVSDSEESPGLMPSFSQCSPFTPILDGQNSLDMWLQGRTEASWKSCRWATKTGHGIWLRRSGRALDNLAELPSTGWDVLESWWRGSWLSAACCAHLWSLEPHSITAELSPLSVVVLQLVLLPHQWGFCAWAIKICSNLNSAIKLVTHECMYLPGHTGN